MKDEKYQIDLTYQNWINIQTCTLPVMMNGGKIQYKEDE